MIFYRIHERFNIPYKCRKVVSPQILTIAAAFFRIMRVANFLIHLHLENYVFICQINDFPSFGDFSMILWFRRGASILVHRTNLNGRILRQQKLMLKGFWFDPAEQLEGNKNELTKISQFLAHRNNITNIDIVRMCTLCSVAFLFSSLQSLLVFSLSILFASVSCLFCLTNLIHPSSSTFSPLMSSIRPDSHYTLHDAISLKFIIWR